MNEKDKALNLLNKWNVPSKITGKTYLDNLLKLFNSLAGIDRFEDKNRKWFKNINYEKQII